MLLARKRRGKACVEKGLLQREALSRDEVACLEPSSRKIRPDGNPKRGQTSTTLPRIFAAVIT